MDICNQIRYCTDFTPAEQHLAQYILKHQQEVAAENMQELIRKACVSKSMIHRFCKKIALTGFSELRVKLAQSRENALAKIDVNFPFMVTDSQYVIAEKLKALYARTVEDTQTFLDKQSLWDTVLLLHKAECIDIYAHANNLNAAENFQDKMLAIGRQVKCQEASYKQRSQALLADKHHVALILSYSGKATFIPQLLALLKERQTPIVWIGRAGNREMASATDYQLYLSDKESFRSRLSQFSSHIAMQYTLDLLFSCIFKMDYEQNIAYLQYANQWLDDRPWTN